MNQIAKSHYDTIVIGAGIAGCCAAYMLQNRGEKVLLIDRSAVPASGGSGAAGAFVSPKIGKGGTLQRLTNQAYLYAKEFYSTLFPKHFNQSGVLRLPKDKKDEERFGLYSQHNTEECEEVSQAFLRQNHIKGTTKGFWFAEAGVCDAPALCHAIWNEVCFLQYEVAELLQEGEGWICSPPAAITGETPSPLRAHNIILATGYQNSLCDMAYMGIKGLWGSRGDYTTDLDLQISMHKKISISSNKHGIVKIGATHIKAENPCTLCDGAPLHSLEQQAKEMLTEYDFRLKEIFCGMRSGSRDYFPLVGKVIDVPWMTERHPAIFKGAKPELRYLKNLYVLNGFGGRGFVFAPLMASWLAALIAEGKEPDPAVNPDRLFLKWARKNKTIGQ